ncbi:MAG: RNA methyltransferase PUA domain-containing protein, partial [Lentisphaerota bacterium]
MRRFFFDKSAIEEGKAIITGNLFRHMVKVLRLKNGTGVTLVDQEGTRYSGLIQDVGRERLIIPLKIEGPE